MKRGKGSKLIQSHCIVCGKPIWASRPATYCIENSSCRVKAHKQRVQRDIQAKRLMMDMELYGMYVYIVDSNPSFKDFLDNFLSIHGLLPFKDMCMLIKHILRNWEAIDYERKKPAQ